MWRVFVGRSSSLLRILYASHYHSSLSSSVFFFFFYNPLLFPTVKNHVPSSFPLLLLFAFLMKPPGSIDRPISVAPLFRPVYTAVRFQFGIPKSTCQLYQLYNHAVIVSICVTRFILSSFFFFFLGFILCVCFPGTFLHFNLKVYLV